MTDQTASIDFLESQIPELSKSAITMAYWETLSSGLSVLEAEDGYIYKVSPDGSRERVKEIPEGIPAEVGQKYIIR